MNGASWDTASGQLLHTLVDGHEGNIMSVAFRPDSGLLASAGAKGEAGEVLIWNCGNGRFFSQSRISGSCNASRIRPEERLRRRLSKRVCLPPLHLHWQYNRRQKIVDRATLLRRVSGGSNAGRRFAAGGHQPSGMLP